MYRLSIDSQTLSWCRGEWNGHAEMVLLRSCYTFEMPHLQLRGLSSVPVTWPSITVCGTLSQVHAIQPSFDALLIPFSRRLHKVQVPLQLCSPRSCQAYGCWIVASPGTLERTCRKPLTLMPCPFTARGTSSRSCRLLQVLNILCGAACAHGRVCARHKPLG